MTVTSLNRIVIAQRRRWLGRDHATSHGGVVGATAARLCEGTGQLENPAKADRSVEVAVNVQTG